MASANMTSAQLKQAIAKVQALSDANWNALSEPIQLMQGDAWIGPSGDRYTGTLQAQRQQMQAAFRSALDALNQELGKVLRREAEETRRKQAGKTSGPDVRQP